MSGENQLQRKPPAATEESPVPKMRQQVDLNRSHISLVEQVYHQETNEQPSMVETRFTRMLKTDEQLHERRVRVGEEWIPIDIGWVEKPSMILVVNGEGRFLQTHPTEDERLAAEAKVLEVAYENALTRSWLILPRESFRGTPGTYDARLMIRCRSGEARATVYAYPA